jgi:hypothetical protein
MSTLLSLVNYQRVKVNSSTEELNYWFYSKTQIFK